MNNFIITSGEPAGIGPDILCQLFSNPENTLPQGSYWVLGNLNILNQRAELLNLNAKIEFTSTQKPQSLNYNHSILNIPTLEIPLNHSIQPGQPTIHSAKYILKQLDLAISICQNNLSPNINPNKNKYSLITAPIDKYIISQINPDFTGHTDYLKNKTQSKSKSKSVTMMLASDQLKISLVTTHIPLNQITQNLNTQKILNTLENTLFALQNDFKIAQPKIAILGLNPHAGENGLLGLEEQNIIEPAIKLFRQKYPDIFISNPLPSDSAFIESNRSHFDAYIAMYHDQGLIPIKTLDFDHCTNITLNLPFIRTSVDHGTAYSLTGTGKSNSSSLKYALNMASNILSQSKRT